MRKLNAERGVKSAGSAASSASALVPISTESEETTASLAVKPEMSAVAQRQSAKPSGAKMGATSRPIMASRLSLLEATTFSRASKLCKNQMATVASKMTVKALERKSLAFSQRRSATLLAEGRR